MGTCCFTPKKTHFLWWYWLALASIVGIPMLLAARHVERRRAAGDPDLAAAGRRAARIFWWSTSLFLILFMVLGCGLASSMAPLEKTGFHVSIDNSFKYGMTWYILALDFFCCFFLANLAVRLMQDGSLRKKGLILLFFCILWLPLSVFTWMANPLDAFIESLISLSFGRFLVNLDRIYPLVAALMFIICFTMAWHWRAFLARPAPATARRALAGFVAGAFLFFLAARYGNLAHFYLYNLARGHLPGLAAAAPYMMK